MKLLLIYLSVLISTNLFWMFQNGFNMKGAIGVALAAAVATIIISHGKEEKKHD